MAVQYERHHVGLIMLFKYWRICRIGFKSTDITQKKDYEIPLYVHIEVRTFQNILELCFSYIYIYNSLFLFLPI